MQLGEPPVREHADYKQQTQHLKFRSQNCNFDMGLLAILGAYRTPHCNTPGAFCRNCANCRKLVVSWVAAEQKRAASNMSTQVVTGAHAVHKREYDAQPQDVLAAIAGHNTIADKQIKEPAQAPDVCHTMPLPQRAPKRSPN